MKIQVITKAKARSSKVVQITDTVYEISVKAPPLEGKANLAVIEAVAEHFRVHKNQVRIISGFTSVNKTVLIEGII
jgi:hypothetical protein